MLESVKSSTYSVRTYCPGTGASGCSISRNICNTCKGRGSRECPGSEKKAKLVQEFRDRYTCFKCGKKGMMRYYGVCSSCELYVGSATYNCTKCGYKDSNVIYTHYHEIPCDACNETGYANGYYCSTHRANLSSSNSSHCLHGYAGQHDK